MKMTLLVCRLSIFSPKIAESDALAAAYSGIHEYFRLEGFVDIKIWPTNIWPVNAAAINEKKS